MAKQPTRSEEETYRLPFFIIASLVMASMIWLVFQEFYTRRPWKDIQEVWFKVERARVEKNLEGEKAWLKTGTIEQKAEDGTTTEVKIPERVAELEKKIKELEGGIIDSPRRIEFERLKGAIAKAEVNVKDHEMLVAFAKAKEDEYYYYYRNAKHHGHEEEEKKFETEVADLHAKVDAASAEYNKATEARDAIADKIEAIRKDLAAAKRELDGLRSGVASAEHAVEATSERYTGIEQYWNQKIELVDRCHTCHMAEDRCGFSDPREILDEAIAKKSTAEDLRNAFCLTRDEATAYVTAANKVMDSFGDEHPLGFDDVKATLPIDGDPVLTATKGRMTPEIASELFRSHSHRSTLLRKHPGQVFGCTTCHYGQGRQTKGVGLNYLAGEVAEFDHGRRDEYWQLQMLDTKRHHVEASCFNCHKNDYELENAPNLTEARKLVQHLGCTGCHPLGPLDPERKHGPTLTAVGSKIDPAWMMAWIKYPRSIRPRTRMPNFWPEVTKQVGPNDQAPKCNSFDYAKGSPPTPAVWTDCAKKRDEEVAYIAAYLRANSEPKEYGELPSWADAAKGKELVESIGCRACHNVGEWNGASHLPGAIDRDLAPNLSNVGDKVKSPGWFFAWIRNPKAVWHETRMPSLRLTEEEAWHIAAFLSKQKGSQIPAITPASQALLDDPASVEKGKKLINWYGCSGCHEIKGFQDAGRIGVDLTEFGSKPVDKLDFGDVPEFASDPHAEKWEPWLRKKVNEPRSYRYERVETRMPQFDLTPHEVDLVVLFLKSQNSSTETWPADIRFKPTAEQAAIQRGNYLVDTLNCRGCHRIDDRGFDADGDHVPDGGDIYKLFAADQEERFRAPPKLINEGRKVYPDWLFHFLKGPTKLRENFRLRMPTFQLSDETAGQLVAYFAAKAGTPYPFVEKKMPPMNGEDQKTAEQLFSAAQCLSCHNLDGVVKDTHNVAPNLRLAASRLQYDWLFDWLKDPQSQIPGVSMPSFFAPDDAHPGEYITPLPQFADGNWRRQIELLRAYVISVGKHVEVAQAPASSSGK